METRQINTVEIDNSGFDSLKDQIINKTPVEEVKNASKETPSSKKFVFKRGDQSLEIDDDYELEMIADKKPVRLTLRELKDRAAGDVAIKNRMHTLSQEKKKVTSTFKEFAAIAKEDPLRALEYISNKAKEADSEFEYDNYIVKLAEQAEKLGQMDEKERKAWERERKLSQAEKDLSQRERQNAVVLRKQEIMSEYPEIGDQQFGQMVDAVLNNETLLEGLESESDVMDRVEELIIETLNQADIVSVIEDINPKYATDNELIFSLSNQIRENPDFDEEDVREIVREIIGSNVRNSNKPPVDKAVLDQDIRKQKDVKTLSDKLRQGTPKAQLSVQGTEPFDVLMNQLLESKKTHSKTPVTMR